MLYFPKRDTLSQGGGEVTLGGTWINSFHFSSFRFILVHIKEKQKKKKNTLAHQTHAFTKVVSFLSELHSDF